MPLRLIFPAAISAVSEKHLPLALGPFAAISLNAARRRAGASINDLLTLFLAGLVIGAALMLLRNGAIGTLTGPEMQSDNSVFGAVNRNFAGLPAGFSLSPVPAFCLSRYQRFGLDRQQARR